MTISILQQATANSGTASSAHVPFANPVTPGSSIYVLCRANSGATTFTCSDSVNGSYPAAFGALNDGNHYVAHCRFDNTIAGTPDVTVTSSNMGEANVGLAIVEVGSTSGFDTHIEQLLSSPGTGTDAVTSGNATPSAQPGLLIGSTIFSNDSGTISVGTGFTVGGTIFNGGVNVLESRRYTSLATAAATFTTTVGGDIMFVLGAWFKESTSAVLLMGQNCYASSAPNWRAPRRKFSLPNRWRRSSGGILLRAA